jgi:hypothetical protein
MARAKAILAMAEPSRFDARAGAQAVEPADHLAHADA